MNLSHYLYIFNHITSHGENRQGISYFEELSAWHDFDGYTCYIGYKDLTMTLYFHGRFSYDYLEKATLSAFTKLVKNKLTEFKVI